MGVPDLLPGAESFAGKTSFNTLFLMFAAPSGRGAVGAERTLAGLTRGDGGGIARAPIGAARGASCARGVRSPATDCAGPAPPEDVGSCNILFSSSEALADPSVVASRECDATFNKPGVDVALGSVASDAEVEVGGGAPRSWEMTS